VSERLDTEPVLLNSSVYVYVLIGAILDIMKNPGNILSMGFQNMLVKLLNSDTGLHVAQLLLRFYVLSIGQTTCGLR